MPHYLSGQVLEWFKMLIFFIFFLVVVVGFVFLYILDMDSMNEENDEYGDIVSSAPKRMRSRTSSICLDFEILPKGPHGKEREKCKKCQNSFLPVLVAILFCCIIEQNAMRLTIKLCLISL